MSLVLNESMPVSRFLQCMSPFLNFANMIIIHLLRQGEFVEFVFVEPHLLLIQMRVINEIRTAEVLMKAKDITFIKKFPKADNRKAKIKKSIRPICFGVMLNGRSLECNHVFHADCISKWFDSKRNCPLCRKLINFSINDFKNESFIEKYYQDGPFACNSHVFYVTFKFKERVNFNYNTFKFA